jgi:hypothetical protein
MIIDCLFRANKKEAAREFLAEQLFEIDGLEYEGKEGDIRKINKIYFNTKYRQNEISRFCIKIDIITPCYYIGCKLHDAL